MKHPILQILYLTVLLLTGHIQSLTAQNGGVYFPGRGEDWETKLPESVGMDDLRLKSAIQYAVGQESTSPRNLEQNHYQTFGREPFGDAVGPLKDRGEATGIVIKNGYIVAEWGDPYRVDMTFSVAKSFLSTTVGLAWDRGLIADVQDKVHPYMAPIIFYDPDAGHNKAENMDQKKVFEPFSESMNNAITWDHLLRQTSGWRGTLWGKPDWADRPDSDPSTWLTRPQPEPGTVYEYNDVRVNLLALACLNVWRRPLPQVLKEYIMDPIGASPTWRWLGYENSWVIMDGVAVQSVSGGTHWGGGMMISARDQARFGYLTLRNGKWNDQQLISEKWISMARTPTSVMKTYGFMNWYLNTDKKLLPSAPETAFVHIGAGTNMIYVDQENDLVVVARWINYASMDEFVRQVLAAIK